MQQIIEILPLLLLVLPTLVLSQSDNTCNTPDGKPGRCISSQQCKFTLDLQRIYRKKLPTIIQKQIEQITCKIEGESDFHLCCPIESVITDKPESHMPLIKGKKVQNLSQINPAGIELLNSTSPVCGLGAPIKKVAYGRPVKVAEFPWVVSLKYDTDGNPFLCGGSLITDRFVLTAAHCITSAVKVIGVHMGEHIDEKLNCSNTSGRMSCKEYDIEDIRPHPLYKKTGISYDIALIKLVQTVKFEINIRPICLPIEPSLQDIPNDQRFFIAGWGLTEQNIASPVLLWATVERREEDVCREYFLEARVNKNHICAVGEGKQHTCQGDSGGPIFSFKLLEKVGRYRMVQYGLVSFGGRLCGVDEGQPGIFASVIDMLPWITQNLH